MNAEDNVKCNEKIRLNEDDINIADKSNHNSNYTKQSSKDLLVYADYPTQKKLSDAHTIGRVVLDEHMCADELVKVLCDTGALSANYVAADLIKRLKSKLDNKQFFETKCRVTLADSKTVRNISTGVKLKLILKDHKAHKYVYTGDFFVLDMKSNDIIVGLPALTGRLYPFMQALLEKANLDKTKDDETNEIHLNALDLNSSFPKQNETTYPWTKVPEEPAPEDEETELPVNFGEPLEFLGKSREEAIQDYKDLLKVRVSDELKDNTGIIDYLHTVAVDAFVPSNWTGVKGIPPLRLVWKDTLPAKMKPRARPINPRLWECSEKEFRRLCGYFYEASRSPWASCLVVAPKATPPYIRFCGDYVEVNKHMEVGNYTIPNVKHELAKIIDFPLYMDIDLTNAFHQIPLHPETSAKLSIQTPWGQYQPKFMPEGIAPATGVLQETVKQIFADMEDWAIVIFDNMLILATDPADAFNKFKKVIERCLERNLVLKMAKSWLGFRKVEFFGYTCVHKSYEVSKDKKEALGKLEFPKTTKQARQLLGKGVFFSSFTPNYSTLTAHLTDMTKKGFNWNKESWKHDYLQEFQNFIKGLQDACELFYPDYNLDWTLRTDASELGVGAVLLQRKITNDTEILQPIAFVSKKFSDTARKWATIEQEAYGIYYAVYTLAYYLIGKQFMVETDHNNLLWMEASAVPKIVRWRIFLQSFNFKLKHISGKKNQIADWLSRTFPEEEIQQELDSIELDMLDQDTTEEEYLGLRAYHSWLQGLYSDDAVKGEEADAACPEPKSELKQFTKAECLEAVHNGKVGHMGARVTWTRLNKQFPGHNLSFQTIQEFVAACPNCNKTRLGMKDVLKPIIRTLKPPSTRTAIGIDAVEITPHSEDGYTHINVVVNLFTKFVALYPVKGVTALNLANSCWKYWCNFGHTDMIISDQGPDLTSVMFEQLTEYMGMRHVFSIADKHANGTERVIGEVVRHLRARVYDESSNITNQDIFKDPSWLDSVQYILNSEVNSETGFTPFELTFGTEANRYMTMAAGKLAEKPHARLSKLNADLVKLNTESKVIQDKLIANRKEAGVLPEEQNKFQVGDYVLFDKGPKVKPKMAHRYLGPFVVKQQVANDVTCQNVATGVVKTFDVLDLKLYAGNKAEAFDMAARDQDQHVIDKILYHTGDRNTRSTLVFRVKFKAGDTHEVPFSKDLFDSIPYEEYCESKPYLRHLKFTVAGSRKFIQEINSKPLQGYAIDQDVYLDIRVYGDGWFNKLQLPDVESMMYVSKFKITKCTSKKLSMINTLTKDNHVFGPYDIYCFVHTEFNPSYMVLIDQAFMIKYPQVTQD